MREMMVEYFHSLRTLFFLQLRKEGHFLGSVFLSSFACETDLFDELWTGVEISANGGEDELWTGVEIAANGGEVQGELTAKFGLKELLVGGDVNIGVGCLSTASRNSVGAS